MKMDISTEQVGFIFQMVAVVAGTVAGGLLGLAGGKGGTMARQGEHRPWIAVVFNIVMLLGGITAICGLVAGALRQSESISLGLMAVGVVICVLTWKVHARVRLLRDEASSKIVIPTQTIKDG